MNLIKNNVELAVSALLSILLVLSLAYGLYLNRSFLAAPNSSWTVGEWMINYAGGFVRRGLWGELVYRLSLAFRISPFILILILSTSSLFMFLYLVWRFTAGRFSLNFILSPVVCMAPALGNFAFRKDLFLLSLFGVGLLIINNRGNYRNSLFTKMALIGAITIAGSQAHEAFLLFGAPTLMSACVYHSLVEGRCRVNLGALKAVSLLAAALLAMVMSFTFVSHGTINTAKRINDSWQLLSENVIHGSAIVNSNPSGAIESLSWTVMDSLARTAEIWSSGSFLPWILTGLLFANIFVGDPVNTRLDLKRAVLILQFTLCLPLFAIGIDYGRWIFIVICSSIFLFGCLDAITSEISPLHWSRAINKESFFFRLAAGFLPGINLAGPRSLVYLFLGLPVCCWTFSEYLNSTPIGVFLGLLR